MALIKLGTLVSDIRGAVGGTIFSRNKGGAYARKNTAPTNANTAPQAAARAIFGAISTAWRSLTAAQQNAWNVAAPSFPYTDIFGDPREYSGRDLFVKLNSQIRLVNPAASLLAVPPAAVAMTAIGTLTMAITATTAEFTINGGVDLPVGQTVLVYASAPKSTGVRSINSAGNFRQIGAFTTTAGVGDFFTAYEAAFGAPVVGQRIFIKTKTFMPASGLTLEGANRGQVVA